MGRLLHRVVVCVALLCLLWLSSLQISASLVETLAGLVTPSLALVLAQCSDHALGVVEKQSRDYASCASAETRQCRFFGEQARQAELRRLAEQQAANAARLQVAQALQSNCMNLLVNVKESIREWAHANASFRVPWRQRLNNTSCRPFAQKQQRAELLLSSLAIGTSAGISTNAVQYSQGSDAVVTRLADYSDKLASYNSHYAENKTRALRSFSISTINSIVPRLHGVNVSLHLDVLRSLDELVQCIGLGANENGTCELGVAGARELYESLQVQMNAQLSSVEAAFSDYNAVYDDFKQRLADAMTEASDFYDSVAGAQGVLRWIVNNVDAFNVIGQLCGKTSPDWCTFSKASFIVVAPAGPKLPQISKMPDASDIWRHVEPTVAAAQGLISEAMQSSSGALQGAFADVSDLLSRSPQFGLEDYHPPEYAYAPNVTAERDDYKLSSAAFRQQTLQSLQNLTASIPTFPANAANASSEAVINAASWVTQLAISAFKQYWQPLVPEQTHILDWLASLLTLQGLLYLFDYLYRGLQTVQIVAKFWSRSVCPLPSVDLQVRRSNSKNSALVSLVFQALPYVWLQILLLVAFIGLAAWATAALYLQAYSNYADTCVHGISNSTFLSRNLYSAAYNYASLEGAGVIQSGIGDYNRHFASVCQSAESDAVRKYQTHLSGMHDANKSTSSSLDDLQTLQGCVDLKLMDQWYSDVCNNSSAASSASCPILQVGKPYQTAQEWMQYGLTASVCHSFDPDHTDSDPMLSTFRCDSIPVCAVECSGPSAILLSQATQQCSCSVEWYLHSRIWQAVLVVLVYACMNLSRVLLTHAVLVLCWRHLDEPIFECRVSCTRTGHFVLPDAGGTEEEENTKRANGAPSPGNAAKAEGVNETETVLKLQSHVVEASLNREMGRYLCIGSLALLCSAVVLLLPGIVFLYVRDNIAYVQHRQSNF